MGICQSRPAPTITVENRLNTDNDHQALEKPTPVKETQTKEEEEEETAGTTNKTVVSSPTNQDDGFDSLPIPPKPRPLGNTDPQVSVDPQREQSVRRIDLQFDQVYLQGEQLGYGQFGVVYEATHILTQTEYAVKKIDRDKMLLVDDNALENEIQLLTKMRDGPNIVQLFEVYEEGKYCILVMEYVRGQDLFERLLTKTRYSESEARGACRCILDALEYMHNQRVCHRDLKPENLLLVSKDNDTTLKLADFGAAKQLETENSCRTFCGTPGYVAPEILEQSPAYDVQCDMWSVGVILFQLVGGCLPFDDDDSHKAFEQIRNGSYTFHPEPFDSVSNDLKHLISNMLRVNPFRRLTAAQALATPWMTLEDDRFTSQSAVTRVITNRYLERRGRQESWISRASAITMGAIIQDDESTTGLPFSSYYDLGVVLGKGAFATVYQASHVKTKKLYAVKDIERSSLEEASMELLKQEIGSLKLLRNAPHVIRLYDVFEEPEHTYLVLELMKGGHLLQRIVDKETYSEREARQVCKILFEAIDYMHKKQIAHRDLKPDNLLLVEENNDTTVKIADFGCAKQVMEGERLTTLCGTVAYAAPEVLSLNGYDTKCDLWSAGVIVYVLLGGYMPFDGKVEEIAPMIMAGSYEFHEAYWDAISGSAKDLVRNLLQVDPGIRFSADQALSSEWMAVASDTLARSDLSVAQMTIESRIDSFQGSIITHLGLWNVPDSINENAAKKSESGVGEDHLEDSSSGKPFDELYEWGGAGLDTQPGGGNFSAVHTAIEKQSGRAYAVKRFNKKRMDRDDADALQDEISALRAVKGNPYISQLHDVFERSEYTFLVTEIIRGSNLIQPIMQKATYSEQVARKVYHSLLNGIEYMHSKDVAHRNLKPDVIFLTSQGIKICNFEFAKRVLHPNSLRTQCGTAGYIAPEVLEQDPAYDQKCDMWSLGVVLYILLCGYRPFRGNGDVLMRQIRYGDFEFHEKYWSHVSDHAMDLIRSLLTVDPTKRSSASEALQSKWMQLSD